MLKIFLDPTNVSVGTLLSFKVNTNSRNSQMTIRPMSLARASDCLSSFGSPGSPPFTIHTENLSAPIWFHIQELWVLRNFNERPQRKRCKQINSVLKHSQKNAYKTENYRHALVKIAIEVRIYFWLKINWVFSSISTTNMHKNPLSTFFCGHSILFLQSPHSVKLNLHVVGHS